jgi:DNA replication protein DnaC
MAATRTEPEAQTLAERKAALHQALAEVEQRQAEEREAEARRRAEAAAAARRAAMTGRSAALADAHAAKLEAVRRAEAAMAEMVSAANDVLRHEAAERAASAALVGQLGVGRTPLSFSREEFARRLVGGICAYLAGLSACRLRQLSYLSLPPNPHTDDAASWAER